jgi:hypothetical protein
MPKRTGGPTPKGQKRKGFKRPGTEENSAESGDASTGTEGSTAGQYDTGSSASTGPFDPEAGGSSTSSDPLP